MHSSFKPSGLRFRRPKLSRVLARSQVRQTLNMDNSSSSLMGVVVVIGSFPPLTGSGGRYEPLTGSRWR